MPKHGYCVMFPTDNAFTFAFEGHLQNPDDMDFMWMVSDIARDLNMLNMAEYFGEKISEKYPENHAGPRNLLKTSQTRGDFETTKRIVDDLIETYGERTVEFFVIDLLAYHYEREEYQEGLDLLKMRFSDFLDDFVKEQLEGQYELGCFISQLKIIQNN